MKMIDSKCIERIAVAVMKEYWSGRYPEYLLACEARRYAFHAALILDACSGSGQVCDIGGGWGALSAVCSKNGLHCHLVDDFADQGFAVNINEPRHRMPIDFGFSVHSLDVTRESLPFGSDSLDVVSSFDSMEHWHRSPKKLFMQIIDVLRPGGTFIIGAPNCVNLRKRLTVPFGYGKWSGMNDWYESDIFRGHVREPDVDDLQYIARDLGLVNIRIIGRNWAGLANPNSLVRAGTLLFDQVLQLRPSVCSDIYLIGNKAN